jgi:chemotaxis response regulator CheB
MNPFAGHPVHCRGHCRQRKFDNFTPFAGVSVQTRQLKPIRVLLIGMSQMQINIVRNILASQEGIVIAGETPERSEITRVLTTVKADVVVTSAAAETDENSYRELLYRRPRVRILTITADGRQARIHRLEPHVTTIVDLSQTSLIAAIRGTDDSL